MPGMSTDVYQPPPPPAGDVSLGTSAVRGASIPDITWRERLTVLSCALVLTCLMAYPTVTKLGLAGRLDTNDGKFSIWNVAWVAHALTSDPRHLFDANIFFPHSGTLAYSELNLVAGALAVPVYALTRNPLAAHNSAVALSLGLAFVSTWVLVRRLTGSSSAALLSAAGYTFSAYTSSHTAEVQLLMIWGFPLVMLAFHHLHRQPTLGAGLGLGAALALTALSCGYYGVFAEGLVGLAALWWMRRERAYWIALGLSAIAAGALVAPVVLPYLHARAAQGVVTAPALDELRAYSADWRAYLRLGSVLGRTWHGWLGSGPEVLFPGIMLTAWAVAGIASLRTAFAAERRTIAGYAVIVILAGWASLGPSAGLYRGLTYLLPGISFLRAPARLAPVVILALAVLAGFGFAAFLGRRTPRMRGWMTAVALTMVCGELWVPWPLQPMPPVPRAYQLLATLPRGAVVEFPFPYQRQDFHNHAWSMLMSTYHWQPMVNGYSDFIPADFEQLALPINGFPNAESLAIMRAHDVRYVVIRWKASGPSLSARCARVFRPSISICTG